MTGASKLSSKNMKPHAKVAELLRLYGKGTNRMLLEDCGVGSMNRAISWKYVHSRLRLILEVEGFSSFRYKFAIGTGRNCGIVRPTDNQATPLLDK